MIAQMGYEMVAYTGRGGSQRNGSHRAKISQEMLKKARVHFILAAREIVTTHRGREVTRSLRNGVYAPSTAVDLYLAVRKFSDFVRDPHVARLRMLNASKFPRAHQVLSAAASLAGPREGKLAQQMIEPVYAELFGEELVPVHLITAKSLGSYPNLLEIYR